MSQVRWGILGAGRISHTFARDIAHCANATVVAVAARSLADAQRFQRDYDIPRAHGGYDGLYADPDVDAIYIATPHTHHAGQSRAAMRAGKSVLCEKPLTATPRECRELMDVAAESGAFLMEAMWTWFLPAIRKAQEWVTAGRIGRVTHIKADFGYPLPYDPARREWDSALGGGCLLEMGVYPVAIADLFMQATPDQLSVRAHLAPNGVEDDVVAVFGYEDRTATLATSYRCKLPNWAYVIGEDGYIAIPDFWRATECSLYRLDERVDHFEDNRAASGFEFQIEAASADILAGRVESPIVLLAASLRFQERMAEIRARFSGEAQPR